MRFEDRDLCSLEAGGPGASLTRGTKTADYVFPFEKLDVWKMAVDLAERVLDLLEKLPSGKHLRLIGQMQAAAVSPSQNIAEGRGRQYKKEFIQFLHIAQGSLFELVTLNEVFRRKTLFNEGEANDVRKRCEQVDRKLNGLLNSLHGRKES
jgi:four helix bundle protein